MKFNRRFEWTYETNKKTGVKYLSGYELTDGMRLFAVYASYAKSLRPVKYYVVADNPRTALKIFRMKHGNVLSVISGVELCDEEETYRITKRAYENPAIVI